MRLSRGAGNGTVARISSRIHLDSSQETTVSQKSGFNPPVIFLELFLLVIWGCCVKEHCMFTISVMNHTHVVDEEIKPWRRLTV